MQQFTIFSPPLGKPALDPGSRQSWGGLSGSASALCIANCAKQFPGLLVVLTENSQQAQRLKAELDFFYQSNKQNPDLYLEEFPDWETLPYDNFSPHQDIVSHRLEILAQLPKQKSGILIASIGTLLHRIIPAAYIESRSLSFALGQDLDIHNLRLRLEKSGYTCVDTVYEHGEFALRGSILDIFPMGSQEPYRIELFDTEIESLRSFDPETQISKQPIDAINLLPGKEYPLDQDGIAFFRQKFREVFDIDLRKCPLYEDVSQGIATAGIEYYLPLFFPELVSLFDYLPAKTLLLHTGAIHEGAEQFWREINSRYEDRRYDTQRPLLAPEQLFIPVEECFSAFKSYAQINLYQQQEDKQHAVVSTQSFPDLAVDHKLTNPLERLEQFLAANAHSPILFCTDSAGRRETLRDLLKSIQVYPEVIDNWDAFVTRKPLLAITIAPVEMGLRLLDPELIVIAESQLFIHHVSQRRRRGKFQDNTDFIVKNLTELHTGAPVVHIDHGVGRYQGLQNFDVEGQQTEFLVLEYAEIGRAHV